MAYKVIILYRLYMPSYFLGTFTEYPFIKEIKSPPSLYTAYFTVITQDRDTKYSSLSLERSNKFNRSIRSSQICTKIKKTSRCFNINFRLFFLKIKQ